MRILCTYFLFFVQGHFLENLVPRLQRDERSAKEGRFAVTAAVCKLRNRCNVLMQRKFRAREVLRQSCARRPAGVAIPCLIPQKEAI